MNSVTLTGRLTQDPQQRIAGELEICDLRLAVPRRKGRDGEDRGAVFIDVTAFGGLASVCGQYLSKGSRAAVSGRLELDEWEAQDGSPRRRHKVIAEEVEFLDPANRHNPSKASCSASSSNKPASRSATSSKALSGTAGPDESLTLGLIFCLVMDGFPGPQGRVGHPDLTHFIGQTLPGVNVIVAASFLAAIGDISRFQSTQARRLRAPRNWRDVARAWLRQSPSDQSFVFCNP